MDTNKLYMVNVCGHTLGVYRNYVDYERAKHLITGAFYARGNAVVNENEVTTVDDETDEILITANIW